MTVKSEPLVAEFRGLLDKHADAVRDESWPEADEVEHQIRELADQYWMEMATCYVEHHNEAETG